MQTSNNIKIIIPISSIDSDFKNEFRNLKILTLVGDKPMIDIFIQSFNFKFEYIFLCRQEDLINSKLLLKLKKLKIKKKILSIPKDTSSALETVLYSDKFVNDNDRIIIAHPDGVNFFDKKKFEFFIKNTSCDGAVCAFNEDSQSNTSETHTGRIIVKNKKLIRVIEKSIKTKDSMRLAGVYYFKSFGEFKKQAKKTFLYQQPVRGRHFISQVYNEYLKKNKKIKIFTFNKHVAFGLISYVKEYNFWFKYFNFSKKNKNKNKINFNFHNIIPSCGEGERFLKINKRNFKPLIKLSKRNMINLTIDALPKSRKNSVIIRSDHDKKYNFKKKIINQDKSLDVTVLSNKTSGMATTCYKFLKNNKINKPLLISSCDYDLVYNEKKLKNILSFFSPDVLVWTFKEYPDARLSPFAYAYCQIKNGQIINISEKSPISNNPHQDHIAQGIFYFKSKKIFFEAYEQMLKEKNMINGEYYVGNSINSLIKKNYKVYPFEVDQYICLGTPEDLKVYYFWENYFNA